MKVPTGLRYHRTSASLGKRISQSGIILPAMSTRMKPNCMVFIFRSRNGWLHTQALASTSIRSLCKSTGALPTMESEAIATVVNLHAFAAASRMSMSYAILNVTSTRKSSASRPSCTVYSQKGHPKSVLAILLMDKILHYP